MEWLCWPLAECKHDELSGIAHLCTTRSRNRTRYMLDQRSFRNLLFLPRRVFGIWLGAPWSSDTRALSWAWTKGLSSWPNFSLSLSFIVLRSLGMINVEFINRQYDPT